MLKIQEHKRTESNLRSETDRYKILFDNNPIPMMVYDAETFNVLIANKAAHWMYGYTQTKLKKMTVFDLHPEGEVAKLKFFLSTEKKSDTARPVFKQRARKKDIFAEVQVIGLPSGEKREKLFIAIDVTERVKTEESIKESVRKIFPFWKKN